MEIKEALRKYHISFTETNGKVIINENISEGNRDLIIKASLERESIPYTFKDGKIIVSLTDEQRPISVEDKDRILKAILFNSGAYIMELSGYVSKQFNPTDVGVSSDRVEAGERYRNDTTDDLVNDLMEQLKGFKPTERETPPPIPLKKEESKDESTEKDIPSAEACPLREATGATEKEIKIGLGGILKIVELSDETTSPEENNSLRYKLKLGETLLIEDSDLTFIKSRYDKVLKYLIKVIAKIKLTLKR